MNRCRCGSGKWAVFGFGASLRENRDGEWRCEDCR